jgi:hypothetical protein
MALTVTCLDVVFDFSCAMPLRGAAEVRIESSRMPIGESCIFWDVTPYSPVNINRRLEGTYIRIYYVSEDKIIRNYRCENL